MVIKVFQIRPDPDRFQSFMTIRSEDTEQLYRDGSPVKSQWVAPLVYVPDPELPAGDFYNGNSTTLITPPRVTETLAEHLKRAGELLPLPFGGDTFTLLNVTPCIDVLNHELTEFRYAGGFRLGIMRYAFYGERFPNISLFKIPEFPLDLYIVEGTNTYAMEFRQIVSEMGLKGLYFREIWNDEPGFHGTPWSIRDYLIEPGVQ